MKHLKACVIALVIALPTISSGQQAIQIDKDGAVAVPGSLTVGTVETDTLTAKSVQADNLDQTLADLKAQVTALTAQIAQQAKDAEWFTYADTVSEAYSKIGDADILNLEFGIMISGTFLKAGFSYGNDEVILVTEPMLLRSVPAGGNTNSPFHLVRFVYMIGPTVKLEFDVDGKDIFYSSDCDPSRSALFHYEQGAGFLLVQDKSVTERWPVSCDKHGPVLARKRSFQ